MAFFWLLSNSDDSVKLLPNAINILFQIRHPFEMERQVDKNEHVRPLFPFAFNQGHKADKCGLR